MAVTTTTTKAAGRGGLLKALWKMRRFLLCGFVFSTFDMATQDPLSAFLYSLVQCPTPQHVASVGCPEGSVLDGSGHCKAEPRSSASWSLSAHCADREHVVKTATGIRGAILVPQQVVGIVALLFVGPAVDHFGRRPILMLAMLCQVVSTGLLLSASLLGMAAPAAVVTTLLAAATSFTGMAVALFQPAAAAMVADLSRGDASLRGDGFAALTMMDNMSLVVGFSTMYPILKMHLVDYAPMWGTFAVLGALALIANGMLLQETMPPPSKEVAMEQADQQQSVFKRVQLSLIVGVRVVVADPFLRVFVLVVGFVNMAMVSAIQLLSPYQVAVLDYDNAQASLCFMVLPFVGALSSAFASPLIRRCGVDRLLLAVLALTVLGLAIMGGGAVAGDGRGMQIAFWVGLTLAAIGYNLVTPCFKTTVSTRVAIDHQGNIFALLQLTTAILQASVGLLWPEYLFDPDATGLRRGWVFLATAGVLFLCGLALLAVPRTSRHEHTESMEEVDTKDQQQQQQQQQQPQSQIDSQAQQPGIAALELIRRRSKTVSFDVETDLQLQLDFHGQQPAIMRRTTTKMQAEVA